MPQDQQPATPRPHEHDTIAVTNIDINCDQTTTYTVEKSIPVPPAPGETNPMNIPRHQSQMVEGEFNHANYFEVRYNGQPFRIKPGETKTLPRYIAEHFAKHLTDHILTRREEQENIKRKKRNLSPKSGLVQSKIERPKTLSEIMDVQQYFLEGQTDQNQQTVDPNTPATDIGDVPHHTLGNLKDEPKTAEEILGTDKPDQVSPGPTVEAPDTGAQVSNQVGVDNAPPEPPTTEASGEPNRDDLVREAVELGIGLTGNENAEEIKSKIQHFAGG